MAEVRFQFDPEKVIQALTYIANADVSELSKLKAAKLLYFCDKYHLLKYGRPVLGDAYYCLDHGPVPSASLNMMNEALDPIWGGEGPFLRMFEEYLSINRDHKYPEFVAKKTADTDVFSGSEVEALNATVRQYGKLSPWKLRELTHNDPTWVIPDGERVSGSRADIPYSLFFVGQPAEVREIWELLQEEQEQDQFASNLAR
jgi:uncharacterized phage-associated protein